MNFHTRLLMLLSLVVLVGAILFVRGDLDLYVTSWFYDGHDFDWRGSALANLFHNLVHPVAVISGASLIAAFAYLAYKRRPTRAVVFLLLTLVIGPGIIVNSILKDHWDRARPLQVTEFGGTRLFTPPLLMASQCSRNCSFVAGDPAMGFWFHSFAYVVPARRRRTIFMSGIGLGLGYGVLRIGMGAHFLSDVFFAGVVVLLASAVVYRLLFGANALSRRWQEFLGGHQEAGPSAPLLGRQLL